MVSIRTRDIEKVVMFDLENCFIKLGDIVVRQREGVAMGSPLSPVLAVLICVKYEKEFMGGVDRERRVRIRRYVDDVWMTVQYRRGKEIIHL